MYVSKFLILKKCKKRAEASTRILPFLSEKKGAKQFTLLNSGEKSVRV